MARIWVSSLAKMADPTSSPKPDLPLKSSRFLGDALLGANRVLGGALGIAAAAFLGWLSKVDVPGWIAGLIAAPLLFLLGGLAFALRRAVAVGNSKILDGHQLLLKVNEVRSPPNIYKTAVCICKVSCETRLRENSQVTFVVDDGWETPVGSGTVRKRLENGETLITFDTPYEGSKIRDIDSANSEVARLRIDRHYSSADAVAPGPPTPQGSTTLQEGTTAPTRKSASPEEDT